MIEQQAKIIACDDTTVWLEAERESTCSTCQVKQGCGTGMLAKHVGKRFSRISVPKTQSVVIGQHVQLAIPEQALLQGAFWMYILPLLFMFGLAAIAHFLNMGDSLEILAGFCGLFIGFYMVKTKLSNKIDGFQAKIVIEE